VAGTALSVATLRMAYRFVVGELGASLLAFASLSGLAALAAVLLLAAYRLWFLRRGPGRSLFGHVAWFSLCGVCLAFAAFCVNLAVPQGFSAATGQALAVALLLAWACFGVGWRVRQSVRRARS